MGELKKLGITPRSRNTVKNILKAGGTGPGPKRGEATWDEFLGQHAASLWQCDFFGRNVLTPTGNRSSKSAWTTFLVFGTQHMDYLCQEYLAHYHQERPHQGRDNECFCSHMKRERLCPGRPHDPPILGDIRCKSRLGGLLKSYHRRAA